MWKRFSDELPPDGEWVLLCGWVLKPGMSGYGRPHLNIAKRDDDVMTYDSAEADEWGMDPPAETIASITDPMLAEYRTVFWMPIPELPKP